MSLKVLLADDSAAIKKVVQLCLQDFGVELKSVGSGKDVLDVAKSFKPDIAFIDVLLPHKTGYEIASEMKKESSLSKTPVVMLWSSFMDLDEKKFRASGADDKLEKPFDVAGLRAMVTQYVPRTQSNPLSKHLEFPHLDFEGDKPAASPASPSSAASAPPSPVPKAFEVDFGDAQPGQESDWSMSSFEDISAFSNKLTEEAAKTSPPVPTAAPSAETPWNGDSDWIRKDLGKFHVPVGEEGPEESSIHFEYTEDSITNTDFLLKPQPETKETAAQAPAQASAAAPAPAPVQNSPPAPAPKLESPAATATSLTESMTAEIKALVEKQARDIIEKAVWKIVPEIAANIIKEEIQRLIGDEK